MVRIAIYGKGGIGKSTTASNLSAALVESGLRVLQIGCDPKADSTSLLTGTDDAPTVLDLIRAGEDTLTLDKLVRTGYRGVMCVEAGGPTPGIGCAGRGIITAFEKLAELDAYSVLRPDVVVYDVLGDVVCGGFAMPLRREYADVVYIVTSGEKMSLYAASNIISAVMNFKTRGYARYGGLILNRRGVKNEADRVFELADSTGGAVIADLPRSETVQQAEALGKTVMEAFPDSQMSALYRELARRAIEGCENGSAR